MTSFKLIVKSGKSSLELELPYKDNSSCAATTVEGYSSGANNDVLLKTIAHVCEQVKEMELSK